VPTYYASVHPDSELTLTLTFGPTDLKTGMGLLVTPVALKVHTNFGVSAPFVFELETHTEQIERL